MGGMPCAFLLGNPKGELGLLKNQLKEWSTLLLALFFSAFNCEATERPIILPIKLLGNFPVVIVKIDGSNVPLVFDSGNSAPVALTQTVIDRVKAVSTGNTTRGLDAKGNVLEKPKYTIHRVQIGTAVFTNVLAELDVHDPSYEATQVGQQGFLGTSLLKRYKVVIDYPHRRIVLATPGGTENKASKCTGSVVPFSPQWDGEPAAEASTEFGRLVMWWDTGTPTSVLSKRFVQASTQVSEDTLTLKHLFLGGHEFGPWQFEVWDVALPRGFDGLMGYSFFARHVVCIDFPNKRLLIQN